MTRTPYTKSQVQYLSSELVKAIDTLGGLDAITSKQVASCWIEIPLEGKAKVVLHNANQINTLYGVLNGVDMLGKPARKLSTNEANSHSHGVPGKSIVVDYRPSDFVAMWGAA